MVIFTGVAVAQGLFLALQLWLHAGVNSANRWLAAGLVAFSLVSLDDVIVKTAAVERLPHLAYVFDWMLLLIGPLIYRYVAALTGEALPTTRSLILHALPALLLLLALAPFYVLPAALKLQTVRVDLAAAPHFDPLLLLAAAQLLCYWVGCLWLLQRFRQRSMQNLSNLDRLKTGWLSGLLISNLLVWLAWLITLLLGQQFEWIEAVVTPLAIYALGYWALRNVAVFGSAIEPLKYAKSSLSVEQLADLRQRLHQFVALEKPYLETELKLADLAGRVGISAHNLSQLFSRGYAQTFYDYINQQRVAEVQRCLQDPAYASQTLLDVAIASGFSSKAAFNAAFKKHTGITPSVFRDQLAAAGPARLKAAQPTG